MKISPTALPEVLVIEPQVFGDHRGFFLESYNQNALASEAGIEFNFVQDNHSCSVQSSLRGLHYQIQQPQGKLVRVIVGTIFDVSVDIRRHSPTFGQWVSVILSARNKHQLWIPPGFAHGFLALSEMAEVFYKVTDYYALEHERSLLWNDPDLAIDWPLGDAVPILSAKDRAGKTLKEAEVYE